MRQVQGAHAGKASGELDRPARRAPAQTIDAGAAVLPADTGMSFDAFRMWRKIPLTVWVTSAGYGLIPAWAPVKPYAATFDRRVIRTR